MEIILKEDIIGLGFKNDILTVKNGYGRNYLIPTGKAIIASPSAKKQLAEDLRQRAHKLAKIKQEAQDIADKLAKLKPLVIETKVSATGSIYGSVNSLQIADKLKEQGFDIDRKIIQVKDVKSVGSYVAHVRLHKEVTAEVPFEVVAEGEPAKAAAKEETKPAQPAEAAAPVPAAEPQAESEAKPEA